LSDSQGARIGLAPMSAGEALQLFDASLGLKESFVVLARFDRATLRGLAGAELLPPILRGLVRPARRQGAPERASLIARLTAAPARDREAMLLDVVRSEVASVLGHSSADAVESHRPFKEQGMDSLAAIKLRNRLAVMTGLRLPSTLVFERPTPAAVAELLNARLDLNEPKPPIQLTLDKLASILESISSADERRLVAARLRSILASIVPDAPSEDDTASLIESATADEIFAFVDKNFIK
jgi:acyl carrier protein